MLFSSTSPAALEACTLCRHKTCVLNQVCDNFNVDIYMYTRDYSSNTTATFQWLTLKFTIGRTLKVNKEGYATASLRFGKSHSLFDLV